MTPGDTREEQGWALGSAGIPGGVLTFLTGHQQQPSPDQRAHFEQQHREMPEGEKRKKRKRKRKRKKKNKAI